MLEPLSNSERILLKDEKATENIGKKLAGILYPPLVIYLKGELGAGKTTLVRGFLRGLNYEGKVKSPTFTLVEEYSFEEKEFDIYHFDFYRLQSAEELEFMGIREYFHEKSICFIEWPERGLNVLPLADIQLELKEVDGGRELDIQFFTELGLSFKTALLKEL